MRLLILLLLFFTNCKESEKTGLQKKDSNSEIVDDREKPNKSKIIQKDSIEYVSKDSFAKFEDINITDTILDAYVTNITGSKRYLRPNIKKRIPKKIEFGSSIDKIYKIEGSKEWCLIESTVRADTIINDIIYKYNTNTVLVYVDCNDFSTKKNLKINDKYLNFGEYYNYKTDVSRNNIYIDSILQISILSKREFDELDKSKVDNFIVTDSIKKDNGILKLPITEKPFNIFFNDRKGEGGVSYRNDYYGSIPFLNSYLVGFSGYEEYIYSFYNKTTGEEKVNFINYPLISPDKKNIISFYDNPHESLTAIQLAKINSESIENTYYFNLIGWLPYKNSIEDYYWVDNNTIAFKAILNIRDLSNNFITDFFYIKVEIKGA